MAGVKGCEHVHLLHKGLIRRVWVLGEGREGVGTVEVASFARSRVVVQRFTKLSGGDCILFLPRLLMQVQQAMPQQEIVEDVSPIFIIVF